MPHSDKVRDRVRLIDERLARLRAEKDRLVQDLHELELDRATGKLSEEDYRELDARLKRRAVETIKEIDARKAARSPFPDSQPGGRTAASHIV